MLKGNLNCFSSVALCMSRSYCRRQTVLSIYGEPRVSTLDFHFTEICNSRLCFSRDRSFHSYYKLRSATMSVGNVDSSFRYRRYLTTFCWLVLRAVILLLVFTTCFGCRLYVPHIGSFQTASLISMHLGPKAIRLLKAADTFWLVIEVCLAFLGCAAFHLNANCAQKTCWAAV